MARIQTSSLDSLAHIFRKITTHNKIFTNEKNEIFSPHLEKNIEQNYLNTENFKNAYLEKCKKEYEKNFKQKIQKNTNLSYSFVLELNSNTTCKNIYENFAKQIEDELDTKIFAIAIHKDEGCLVDKESKIKLVSGANFILSKDEKFFYFVKKDGKLGDFSKKNVEKIEVKKVLEKYDIEKNYHAHIEFSGLRTNGKSIKDSKDERLKNNGKKKTISRYTTQYATQLCQKANEIFNIEQSNKVKELLSKFVKSENQQAKKIIEEIGTNFNIKRIKSFKYAVAAINKLLDDENLNERDFKFLKSALQEMNAVNFLNAEKLKEDNLKKEEKEEQEKAKITKKEAREIVKIKLEECKKDSTVQDELKELYNLVKNAKKDDIILNKTNLLKYIEMIFTKNHNEIITQQENITERLTATSNALKSKNDDLTRKNIEMSVKLENQENTIAEQNKTIENQNKELSNFNNLKANLADREQRLSSSIYEIEYLKAEIEDLKKQIEDKDIEIQAKDGLLAKLLGSKPKKEEEKEDTIKKANYNQNRNDNTARNELLAEETARRIAHKSTETTQKSEEEDKTIKSTAIKLK